MIVPGSSPFAEQWLIRDVLAGEAFEHFQHVLPAKEEAVIGLLCIGYTVAEVAGMLKTTRPRVKQIARAAIFRMRAWLQEGK